MARLLIVIACVAVVGALQPGRAATRAAVTPLVQAEKPRTSQNPGVVYDQETAKRKLAELMSQDPEAWAAAIKRARERGLTFDPDRVYFWERGTKNGVRSTNVGLLQDFSESNGQVIVYASSATSDRFRVAVYTQAYATTEEMWNTLDFQPTSDTDGIVTFETWDDFRDTHGHDPGVVCRRAFCDGGVQHQFMSPVPRLRNASMQSPCDLHPACATIQAKMSCLGDKFGASLRYLQAAFGGSLAGCFIGWSGFGNYAFCVGRGSVTGFGAGLINNFYFGGSC